MIGRDVGLYLAIALGFSWTVGWVVFDRELMTRPLLFQAAALIYMSGPALAALVCASIFDEGRRRDALGLRWRWNLGWLWAWTLPVALIGIAFLVDLAFSDASFDPAGQMAAAIRAAGQDPAALGASPLTLYLLTLGSALTIGAATNAVLTLTEELGWRGWLWDRWRRFGFWRCNLAIGVVWGVWHAPLILQGYNYPEAPLLGVPSFVLFTTALSPLIGWVREVGGTVWHAGLFHGTVNALAGVALMGLAGLELPFKGALGVGGAAGMALLLLLVALARQGRSDEPTRRGVHA